MEYPQSKLLGFSFYIADDTWYRNDAINAKVPWHRNIGNNPTWDATECLWCIRVSRRYLRQ